MNLLLALLLAQTALHGHVVAVHDGDTVTVLTEEKTQVKIRLAEIDAPELGQPFGTKAKWALSDLVFGKEVRVEKVATDRYRRTVGRIRLGSTDINMEMVREGMAWCYRQYFKDKSCLVHEDEARKAKLGLWASEAEQPWAWRSERRAEAKLRAVLNGK